VRELPRWLEHPGEPPVSAITYDPYGQPTRSRPVMKVLLGLALLGTLAALAGMFLIPAEHHAAEPPMPVRGVSRHIYPATLVQQIATPAGGESWLLPAAAAPTDEGLFIVDTGNNRILQLDASAHVAATFGPNAAVPVALNQPMDMVAANGKLYVANSLGGNIVVLEPSGKVARTIPLPQVSPADRMPRPLGIAVNAAGQIVVSDGDNNRVLFLDAEGGLITAAGTGTRSNGRDGFNVPSRLALDSAGNVYVVDTLNGRVVKLSPDGVFLQQFGEPGDTAGTLSRPKGVAVDSLDRVYVSDGLQAAVQVFGPDGSPLGFIGREQPGNDASDSIFRAPGAMTIIGDRLYVVDRFAGVITLRLNDVARAAGT
jgi:DNA-binding beta-propeller fold protein YncE